MTLTVKTRPERHLERRRSPSRPRTSPTPSTSWWRSAPAVQVGRRRPAVPRDGGGDRREHGRLHFKVPAPRFFEFIAYKFDIGVYIVPKHIFEGQDWATFTHFDLAKGWPVTTAPWRVVFSSAGAEGARPRRFLVGRGGRRRQAAGAGALHLPPRSGRAGAGDRHHLQPVRHHHRYPAGHLPDRLRRQRQGHHLDRPGGAVRQRRLVAALPLPQQRESRPGRPERPLGDQLLPRPRADHRHRLDRRQPPLHPLRARLPRPPAVRRGRPAD